MLSFRLQLGLRQVAIAVALIAINLAAALATSEHYPRPRLRQGLMGSGQGTYVNGSDGSYTVYEGNPLLKNLRNPRVLTPPRPTLLRVWSPVIASSAVTLAVLAFATLRKRHIRPGRLKLTGALIVINLAGVLVTASYYPRPELLWSSEGWVWNFPIPEMGESYTVYQGEVFEKEGKLTRAILTSRTTLLRIWSPVIGSSVVTLVVLAFELLRRRRAASCSSPSEDSRFEPS